MTEESHSNFIKCFCLRCEQRRRQVAFSLAMIEPGDPGEVLKEVDGVVRWVKPTEDENL